MLLVSADDWNIGSAVVVDKNVSGSSEVAPIAVEVSGGWVVLLVSAEDVAVVVSAVLIDKNVSG